MALLSAWEDRLRGIAAKWVADPSLLGHCDRDECAVYTHTYLSFIEYYRLTPDLNIAGEQAEIAGKRFASTFLGSYLSRTWAVARAAAQDASEEVKRCGSS